MKRPTSRRQFLTRRRFIEASVCLCAAVAGQACIGGPGTRPSGDLPATPAPRADDQPPSVHVGDGRAGLPAVPPTPAAAPTVVRQTEPEALTGLAYVGVHDPDSPASIRPHPVVLSNLLHHPGEPWRLRGRLVEVVNHGVLVLRDQASGRLHGAPMGNAETSSSDGFNFRPRSGGPLPWENEGLAGADNARALEAARFGEVTAYYIDPG